MSSVRHVARSSKAHSLRMPLLPHWRRQFARLSFKTKLLIITTAISLLCLLIASMALATNEYFTLRSLVLNRSLALADVIAANSQAALSFEDRQAAQDLLVSLNFDGSIDQASLLRAEAGAWQSFADFRRRDAQATTMPTGDWGDYLFNGNKLHVLRPVLQDGRRIGGIYLQIRLEQLDGLLLRFAAVTAALALFTVLLAWLLARRLQRTITAQVTELLDTTQVVRRDKDYAIRSRVLAEDELGELAHAVNAMLFEVEAHDRARERVEQDIRELNEQLEAKVQYRTQDLAASNLDLQEAVSSLKRTQTQLVESEKMAALGGLVAGVAHEINTPIGICVTVASHLRERLLGLREAYARGMRRSDLEAFIEEGDQAIDLISGNLRRAADLVRSFKQVAVDQSSEDRRKFDLATYAKEILISLSPRLKRRLRPIEVDVQIEEGVQIDSFPGVFAQILTNLVMNSLIHAFDEDSAGQITISGQRSDKGVCLTIEDNGRGMDEETRARIFEPFFTTKRGSGGSGLGLHITFNQVTRQLGGSIRCESSPGQGAQFALEFPCSSPEGHSSAP